MERFDKYWIGIVLGLIMPAVVGYLYIDQMNLWYALQTFQFESGSLLNKLLLVCVFPNMAFLYVFYLTDTWRLAKGVLIGALPYIMASLIISF